MGTRAGPRPPDQTDRRERPAVVRPLLDERGVGHEPRRRHQHVHPERLARIGRRIDDPPRDRQRLAEQRPIIVGQASEIP